MQDDRFILTGAIKQWIRPFYLKWLYFHLRPDAKPVQWTACWDFPEQPLPAAPEEARPPDFLFLPMVDWHARMQRPQHLALALAARGHRCFYLNPNLGRQFPQPAFISGKLRVCRLHERVWEVHAALAREPVFHHGLLTRSETQALVASIDRLAAAFSIRRPAVICQFPLWTGVASALRDRYSATLVYDCHDLLSGFSRIAPSIVAAERELLEAASLVLFSAASLQRQMLAAMPWLETKSLLVPNAVDVARFPLSPAQQPVAGYAGALDEWFDVEAVRCAAECNPGCEFALIGRVEDRRVLALESLPNIRFHGEIPYDQVPAHLSRFRAGLIPFLRTPLTLATNPIKLYEYFSCGLPVVSAALPEVEAYGELVYLASSPKEFAAQLSRAMAETDESLRRRRRRVAEDESWQARAAAVHDAVAHLSFPMAD
jgi:glycosyltransferase involved in cell wall biosynthesis